MLVCPGLNYTEQMPDGTLLVKLAQCKGLFGAAAARDVATLLRRAERVRFNDSEELIQFHETLLFLRAYPQNEEVVARTEKLLGSFAKRLQGMDRAEFEYADISGVAGTGLTTNFSYPFAKSLAERHGDAVGIDWDRYTHSERLGSILARMIPGAFEDWAISAHPDWRAWYENDGGGLRWLMGGVSAEVYDLLELPLRWEFGDSATSRSALRHGGKRIFYHGGPLLARKDVSIAREFAGKPIAARKLGRKAAGDVMAVIVDASAARYRELYGFLYPDLENVFHADLGRGMDLYFFGVALEWRLPNRDYLCGMYFKNGVPMGYVEVMYAKGRMEVGFNLYYTFRQGETAWLYARLLKLFGEQTGVTKFFIDVYQLGHDNEEAIESGAFWFYYKLGFRPESAAVAALAERELAKVARYFTYRTGARVLRKLAKAEMVYPA